MNIMSSYSFKANVSKERPVSYLITRQLDNGKIIMSLAADLDQGNVDYVQQLKPV